MKINVSIIKKWHFRSINWVSEGRKTTILGGSKNDHSGVPPKWPKTARNGFWGSSDWSENLMDPSRKPVRKPGFMGGTPWLQKKGFSEAFWGGSKKTVSRVEKRHFQRGHIMRQFQSKKWWFQCKKMTIQCIKTKKLCNNLLRIFNFQCHNWPKLCRNFQFSMPQSIKIMLKFLILNMFESKNHVIIFNFMCND